MTRNPVIQFEMQLKQAIAEMNKVINRLKRGEPQIYLMGYLYPEEINNLLEGASWKKLDYAIGDLEDSKVRFRNIASILREESDTLKWFAEILESRDGIVDVDIARLREEMGKLRAQ